MCGKKSPPLDTLASLAFRVPFSAIRKIDPLFSAMSFQCDHGETNDIN